MSGIAFVIMNKRHIHYEHIRTEKISLHFSAGRTVLEKPILFKLTSKKCEKLL